MAIVTLFKTLFGIAVAIGIGWPSGATGEPPPRAPLDMLWEQHMLDGTFVVMALEGSGTKALEVRPRSVEPRENYVIYGPNMSHPISVMKLGEGLFGNGG